MIIKIKKSWGWVGIDPVNIICENEFGNILVTDVERKIWRICPEELSCEVIAQNRKELDILNMDQTFLVDWHMSHLVEKAKAALGELPKGKKYGFVKPGVLGGEYEASNLVIVPFEMLIEFSGWLAEKINELPDGTKVKFKPINYYT